MGILPGQLLAILLLAAVFALSMSIALLRLYRRAVLRSMHTRADLRVPDPATLEASASSDQHVAMPPETFPVGNGSSVATSPAAEALRAKLLRAPRRAAAIYAVAGFCYALVLTVSFLAATESEYLLFRFLSLVWVYGWPIVLTVNLVAAATPHAKLANTSLYFLGVAVLDVVAFVRNPALTLGSIIVLWLVINGPATVLLFAFLNRRVRAVGPLVMIFMVIVIVGSQLAISIVGSDEGLLRFISNLGLGLGFNAYGIYVGLILLGLAVFGLVGWLTLQWIRKRYERKKISDQSVTLDAVWLLFAAFQSIVLIFGGTGWILSGLVGFVFYKVVSWAGFSLLSRRGGTNEKSPNLLLLRVFSLGKRSERLFDALGTHWRYGGGIRFIAGPDLATTTVEPHEFLDFLTGKLARRFIDGIQTLNLRISEMDMKPDRDGRFRVNDFFCYEDTWRMVLSRLAGGSDAVLMDLRGFSPENEGVRYEIEELIDAVPLGRVVFVVDETTDEQHLGRTVQESWDAMRMTSPNLMYAKEQLRFFWFTGSRNSEFYELLQALCVAAKVRLKQ